VISPRVDAGIGATAPTMLNDGTPVVIRPIEAEDEAQVREAFRTADADDLRRRFMGCAPPVEVVLRYFRRVDGLHNLALGAFTDARLVGVAQFDRPADDPSAEFAVEVAHDFQRRGLGHQLLTHLEDSARHVGVHELTATFYADNLPIRRLLGHSGQLQSTSYESGEGAARLNLDAARATS
jgi:GNAT superfamily N-acetyltransferase